MAPMFANVAVTGIQKLLTYKIPNNTTNVQVGSKVLIPLRGRDVTGFIIELPQNYEDKNFKVKEIKFCTPFFNSKQIKLFKWMTSYYGTPLYQVLDNANFDLKEVQYVDTYNTSKEANCLNIDDIFSKRSHRKKEIYNFILGNSPISSTSLKKSFKNPNKIIKELVILGLITISKEEEGTTQTKEDLVKSPINLNEEQDLVYREIKKDIENSSFSTNLLYGVTGSGKTEVYTKLIESALLQNKSALFLVPEIALTPQLCDRLENSLGLKLGVMHSRISPREKSNLWRDIQNGRKNVVMGARSALFAPLNNIGVIIIDEEHDSSYKQSDNFRYQARDAAVVYAKISNCPIIMGSATPSFESIYNAQIKKYKIHEITKRANNRPMPEIEVVNLIKEPIKSRPSPSITIKLKEKIEKTLEDQNQVIILYNKRGFSSYLFCKTCLEVAMCPHCSVSLTFHQSINKLICHYCDYKSTNIEKCTNCNSKKTHVIPKEQEDEYGILHKYGAGTESVYEELSELFPSANIIRMDKDSVSRKGAHKEVIDMMKSGNADILVGTQMIAKGHDIENVTLVGIVDADIGLNFPDFRASEQSFQLISQAGGRAGRGQKKGHVIIQTSNISNPTIKAASEGRFKSFVKYELQNRKMFSYPPYYKLLRIIVAHINIKEAKKLANTTKDFLLESYKTEDNEYSIFGPTSCTKQKIKDLYRFNLVIKSNSSNTISKLAKLAYYFKLNNSSKESRIVIDVDPYDML